MTACRPRSGFTFLELIISVIVVLVLLAVLLPALFSARQESRRARCAGNLRALGQAWANYLEDHDEQFPYVPVQPGWQYAGVRYSFVDDSPFLDTRRPLSRYVPWRAPLSGDRGHPLLCPGDCGIQGETGQLGTGGRTACRSFGTSYRANAALLDAQQAGLENAHRGLAVQEIMTVPARLLLLGDAVWYEVYEETGWDATWHGQPGIGNLLFLDGSVRFEAVRPQGRSGPVAVMPRLN